MNMFRTIVESISSFAREKGVEESDLSDAWNQAYQSMDARGPYFLYEDGFTTGDASEEEIRADAKERNLNLEVLVLEEPTALLNALDEEFLELYESNVDELIRMNSFKVISIYWKHSSEELMILPSGRYLICGSEGMEVIGTEKEIQKLIESVEENPENLEYDDYGNSDRHDLESVIKFNSYLGFLNIEEIMDWLER